jgi:hypothetical protein
VEFKTSFSRSVCIGPVISAGLGVGAIALVSVLVSKGEFSLREPLSPLTAGLSMAVLLDLVLLALLLYWSIAALRLRYRLDRNGLVIYWGASRLVVPMERIQAITPGREIGVGEDGASGWRSFRGVAWPGLRAGRAQLPGDEPARVFSTASLAQSTVVLTPDCAYVVSPRDADAFIEAWRVRRPLGPTQYWREEEQRAGFLDLPIWRDRWAWTLIGLSLLANLVLYGYLALVYDRLPAILPFHFDVLGQADRIAPRAEILRLPLVALLMLALDLGLGLVVYGRQRIAAYLVWSGGLVLQMLVWGAVLTIVG